MSDCPSRTAGLDWDEIRRRLQGDGGARQWSGLEELADSPEFEQWLTREFPAGASAWKQALSRRHFLQLMGASLALAGCTNWNPRRDLLPYVDPPEQLIPGKPLYFATSMPFGGYAMGLLAENHMGRPTKIEGNPEHPANLGATDVFCQASVLTLYDPERARVPARRGRIATWDAFAAAVIQWRRIWGATRGRGVRLLTGTVTSPTLLDQIQGLLREFPEARWHQYDPTGGSHQLQGTALAFGQPLNPVYNFEAADVVFSLNADFFSWGPGRLRYSREFARRRKVWSRPEREARMNRLYSADHYPTLTAAMADHRLVIPPSQTEAVAWALARELGVWTGGEAPPGGPFPPLAPEREQWTAALARDLLANRGGSLVLAGEPVSPAVHGLFQALNAFLGNVGNTVAYTVPPVGSVENHFQSLAALTRDMHRGVVEYLFMLDVNPVYSAPADVEFAQAMERVPVSVHAGLYRNETSRPCTWHLPMSHYLESWGDLRAYDGTASLTQPLIEPLYASRSDLEILAMLRGEPRPEGREILRAYWRRQEVSGDFEQFWRRALYAGFLPDSAPKRQAPLPAEDWVGRVREAFARPQAEAAAQGGSGSLEIAWRPDPNVWDGEFANNAWLQELPKPMTKLTWDNAAFFGPATAERLGLDNEDIIRLRFRGREVEAPVYVLPGHAADTVTVTLGYGRERAGAVGNALGYSAYAVRVSEAPWHAAGAGVERTGRRYPLANAQGHWRMEGRNLVRAATLDFFRRHPEFVRMGGPHFPLPSLYPEYEYDTYAWGMAIDQNLCTGCGACVVACQAENNIPVVGKEGVRRSREMHWLRIDRYFQGDLENPEILFQPMLCQHCEKAPCELVCPVEATAHSGEGLNEMIYNRCIGTRYCSNNCPYKVRRFNFLQYANETVEGHKLVRNPDVTVRSRGVMEKCTYCVQRIEQARIEASKENRSIRADEFTTACAQACPTEAITFGDINNSRALVTSLKTLPQNYGVLAELNTQPRTTYLAKIWNRNPALGGDAA